MTTTDETSRGDSRHRIVIVSGGAGARAGQAAGRQARELTAADITLIDKARSHVRNPKLHEIAAGSMGAGVGVVVCRRPFPHVA